MIHIIDDWYLDTDDKCFVLKRDTGSFDKNNNKMYVDYTYHSTLEQSLSYLMRKYQKNATELNMEISSYLELCKTINQEFVDILKDIKTKEVITDV